MPHEIDELLQKSLVPKEQVSVWVAPVDGVSPIIEWQSHLLRPPASVEKVITTGMGLLLLGDDYRWRVEFYSNAAVNNGVLAGDLYIKGYGNPYLVEENMHEMVEALHHLGIKHIEGRVVLDNSYFIRRADNPDRFDGHGMEPYNALPNALNVNFSTADLIFDADGQGVQVKTDPEMDYLHIENHMVLHRAKDCRGRGFSPQLTLDRENQTLIVRGTMSSGCGHREMPRVIGDAGDLFYGYFKRAWNAAGGTVAQGWLYGVRPDAAKPLYVWRSQPLFEQIAAMNKYSNNVMTRQLFLTIGAELTQPPATLAKARAVVRNRLDKMGVDVSQLFIDNGSGLSRHSRISAAQLGKFMKTMGQDARVAPFFEQSLSIVGVDGTLRKRLKSTPLEGNAAGKTGTLDGVKSLAGYLTAKSGRKFVYVIMLEGKNAKSGRSLMDEIMLWTYYNH